MAGKWIWGKGIGVGLPDCGQDAKVVVNQDVDICNDCHKAKECVSKILRSLGPDKRKTQYQLFEEFQP